MHKSQRAIQIDSLGTSMTPYFLPGDRVHSVPVLFSKIRVYDVIMFTKWRKIITHRVVYKTNTYCITKGDNNFTSDGRVYPKQIIGKISAIRRKGKRFTLDMLYRSRFTLYSREILSIVRLFEKLHIDYVFLKGLPLYWYYERKSSRSVGEDTDLLVSPEQFYQAELLLKKRGFSVRGSSPSGKVSFYKKTGSIVVAVNIHKIPPFLVSKLGRQDALYPYKESNELMREMLKLKRIIKLAGVRMPILSAQYQIVFTSFHLLNYNYRGALRYEFFNTILQKEYAGLSQNKKNTFLTSLIAIYHRFKLCGYVYPSYLLLKKFYNPPVPDSFYTAINPHGLHEKYSMDIARSTNIFNDKPSVSMRFKILFCLSPVSFYKRIRIFLNGVVLRMIVRVGLRR
jgi:signal peptidase I